MNSFLIRTPIFTQELLYDFHKNTDPTAYIYDLFATNPLYKESIYLNSRVLYNEAVKYSKEDIPSDDKKKTRIAHSLIRYFLRMCYRSTPFGVAAGVSIAEFERPDKGEKINYEYRSVKIDTSVIASILKIINQIGEFRNSMTFYTNNTLFQKNNFYRFFEKKHSNISFDFTLVKVDANEFIDEILNIGQSGLRLEDIRTLLNDDEDLDDEDIECFIGELVDNQLLVSEFQYDVLNLNFEKEFIERIEELNKNINLEEINEIIQKLSKVFELIRIVENIKIGSDEVLDILVEIDFLLSNYNGNDRSAIQIDLIKNADFGLSSKIKNEIEKKLPFFSKISSVLDKNENLPQFKKEFLNRYGNEAIPLLEALDLDIGIGYPTNLTVNQNSSLLKKIRVIAKEHSTPSEIGRWDYFLLEKYEKYLKDGAKSIKLENKDFNFIDTFNSEINNSILFTGQIIGPEDGLYGCFVNSIKVGTAQFTAGRFAYGEQKIQKYIENIAVHEMNQLAENQVYAEIKHFSQPRLGNLASRPNYYNYYIPIYDSSEGKSEFEISLSDLYLYLENDKLILYSKKLNKQIIPKLGCAQNTSLLTCSIYNFLGKLGEDYFMSVWDWGFLKNKFHLPRIQYDNFILSKERWMLNYSSIFSNSNDIKILAKYLKTNEVSRYVTMSTGGDNYIPLDLNCEISIVLLHDELVKSKRIILEESLNLGNECSIVSNDYGKTTNEIHVPILLGDNKLKKEKVNLEKIKKSISGAEKHSYFKLFPDAESLFLKIYIKNSSADNLFIEKLIYFISELRISDKFEKFFFIRYVDPDYHFRLRFFSHDLDAGNILSSFNAVFKKEIQSYIIDRIQIDTYERETERYGGILGIEISERIFYYDSLCVLDTLLWIHKNDKEEMKWLIAMHGVHHLFLDFSEQLENRLKILENLRDYYYASVSNRTEINKQCSLLYQENKRLIELNMESEYFEENFIPFFRIRSNQNKTPIQELKENKVNYDVANYIHMFLNRYFESNQNQQEMIIYDLLIRYYKLLKFKTKK